MLAGTERLTYEWALRVDVNKVRRVRPLGRNPPHAAKRPVTRSLS